MKFQYLLYTGNGADFSPYGIVSTRQEAIDRISKYNQSTNYKIKWRKDVNGCAKCYKVFTKDELPNYEPTNEQFMKVPASPKGIKLQHEYNVSLGFQGHSFTKHLI